MHETDSITHGEVWAGGDEGLAGIVQDDAHHQQVASPEQPWSVPVGYGVVEDRQAEGYQDGLGDDQGLDGSQGELVGKVTAVSYAYVLAEVGGQRVRQL